MPDLSKNRPSMRFFLCRRIHVVPQEQVIGTADAHLEWMAEQHARGTVLLSGPGSPVSGPEAGELWGMYLIRAQSLAEAEAIAAGDPITERGLATFELIEWEVHQLLGVGPFTLAGVQSMFATDTAHGLDRVAERERAAGG